ncbi:hypothetical protein C9J22_10560 [Photobacterium phosphoreum]|uniref:DUF5677 domain-containing protein n=1 Tax=Photobacterium phosphoreum TaxID=659 RepID=UPI000D1638C7|nr:DUF5677 domain-containing protein [Photobacterium phosphoreum]PSU70416.1 hypothetical protein C9J22_10560 [Photobacterium phosphoreum]PSU76588.1 hypothetical protein CTM67_14490 [Photobacterium phosphoreum]
MYNKEIKASCEAVANLFANIRKITFDSQNDLDFMLICFLHKQLQHFQSISKLLPSQDVQLIVRSMYENLIQLLWVYSEPNRASDWRYFVFVEDWNKLQEMDKQGIHVDEVERKSVEGNYQQNKERFLVKNKNKCHKDWRKGNSIKDVAFSVGAEQLHEVVYSRLSDWHHNGVLSFAHQVSFTNEKTLEFNPELPRILNSSLSVAFQCLYQVAEVVERHFHIGIQGELDQIYQEYIHLTNTSR